MTAHTLTPAEATVLVMAEARADDLETILLDFQDGGVHLPRVAKKIKQLRHNANQIRNGEPLTRLDD